MTARQVHKVYNSLHTVVRAFTDDESQSQLRVNLIARQLYNDNLLSEAAISNGTIIECPEDDEDFSTCEVCDERAPIDEMIPHGDISVCEKCHEAWKESRDNCTHQWREDQNMEGEAGSICERCGWFLHATSTNLPTHGRTAGERIEEDGK